MVETAGADQAGAAPGPTLRKRFAYFMQAFWVVVMYKIFALMPPGMASAMWAWAGRTFGPHLPKSARATTSLKRIFPEKSDCEIRRIVAGVWDNIFRTAVEFVHLPKILATENNKYVEIVGEEKFRTIRAQGLPVMLISGHFANWEIGALPMLRAGGKAGIVYRKSNNPTVDRMITGSRGEQDYEMLPKGREGASGILRIIKDGGQLAMLVDQKFNEGISLPFLGFDAMTSTSAADLAYKYGVVLMPWRPERVGGCRFRLTLYDPLIVDREADRKSEVERVTRQMNDLLGEWIKDEPAQWMWLHRRWPD
jgi:KDO2-lipid IV(A) lauroyltransferase